MYYLQLRLRPPASSLLPNPIVLCSMFFDLAACEGMFFSSSSSSLPCRPIAEISTLASLGRLNPNLARLRVGHRRRFRHAPTTISKPAFFYAAAAVHSLPLDGGRRLLARPPALPPGDRVTDSAIAPLRLPSSAIRRPASLSRSPLSLSSV